MNNKITVEQSNPFSGEKHVTYSFSDIKRTCLEVESKTENGFIVNLTNGDTSIVSNIKDLPHTINNGDMINVITTPDNKVWYDNGEDTKYIDFISKIKTDNVFSGQIVDAVNKGLMVEISDVKTFLPQSQIDYEVQSDLQSYLGSTIDVKVINVSLNSRDNIFHPLVSHKELANEKYNGEINKIKVGDLIKGKVKSIKSYGVFVSLFPTIDGLIQIKDLSWGKVSHPSEVVEEGQDIEVKVLDIQPNKNGKPQIALGLKQVSQKPWEKLDKTLKVGDIVSGIIYNITDYGIFLRLQCGVEGLIHRTELSWDRNIVTKDFHKGDSLEAKVVMLNRDEEKLALSIKQMQIDPWQTIDEKYAIGDKVKGTIIEIAKFGLFVKIPENIYGLIHVKELSWTEQINKLKTLYSKNDEIECVILNINKEKREVELSHKRLIPNPWDKLKIGKHIIATVLRTDDIGIHVIMESTNIHGFIPANTINPNTSYNPDTSVSCIIKEISETENRLILTIE